MHREELLEWLKEYMVQHPTSIERLAPKVGVSKITLRCFYKSNKETSLETLLKIEKFLKENA